MRQMVMSVGLGAWVSCAGYGQAAPPAQGFEVASVKLNRTGTRAGSMEFSKGRERFTAVNVPFGALVLTAYNITVRQLSGLAELLSEKYDISAKAEHPVRAEEMRRMLQILLENRFKLVVRHEMREVSVYALVIGKGGPTLQKSDVLADTNGAPQKPFLAMGTEASSGRVIYKNESMSDFAWALSRMAGIGDRLVVDHTGLKGCYEFELVFERDKPAEPGAGPREPILREGPSLFSALQEQLGLKLESTKAMVEFLIVEHAEKPSEN